jgi:hypothetical protein
VNGPESELSALPSPVGPGAGFYSLYVHEHKLGHQEAFAKSVQELQRMYPKLTSLQANLVMIKAVKADAVT